MYRTLRKIPGPLLLRLRQKSRLFIPSLVKLFYGLPTVEIESLISRTHRVEPPILDDICLPPHYENDAFRHDDFLPLMRIAKDRQPSVVLELGTAYGNTVANLCRQCPGATVYTVNAPADEQTGTLISFELERNEIGRVYRTHGYEGRVVQIFKNTLELDLSQYFDSPVVNLAVIDACHDTEYVTNDFFKVRPYIARGGAVLFHDTHPSMNGHLLGSYRACMMLRRQGYDVRHIKNTWWAIWVNNNSDATDLSAQ